MSPLLPAELAINGVCGPALSTAAEPATIETFSVAGTICIETVVVTQGTKTALSAGNIGKFHDLFLVWRGGGLVEGVAHSDGQLFAVNG